MRYGRDGEEYRERKSFRERGGSDIITDELTVESELESEENHNMKRLGEDHSKVEPSECGPPGRRHREGVEGGLRGGPPAT